MTNEEIQINKIQEGEEILEIQGTEISKDDKVSKIKHEAILALNFITAFVLITSVPLAAGDGEFKQLGSIIISATALIAAIKVSKDSISRLIEKNKNNASILSEIIRILSINLLATAPAVVVALSAAGIDVNPIVNNTSLFATGAISLGLGLSTTSDTDPIFKEKSKAK